VICVSVLVCFKLGDSVIVFLIVHITHKLVVLVSTGRLFVEICMVLVIIMIYRGDWSVPSVCLSFCFSLACIVYFAIIGVNAAGVAWVRTPNM